MYTCFLFLFFSRYLIEYDEIMIFTIIRNLDLVLVRTIILYDVFPNIKTFKEHVNQSSKKELHFELCNKK